MKSYHTDYSKYYKHPYEGQDMALEHVKKLKAEKRLQKGKEGLDNQEMKEMSNSSSVVDRSSETTENE